MRRISGGKRDTRLALIPTCLYMLVMVPLNYFRVYDGPYPFLRVHHQPWYMSILWMLAMLLASFGIAVLLRKICGKLAKPGTLPRPASGR